MISRWGNTAPRFALRRASLQVLLLAPSVLVLFALPLAVQSQAQQASPPSSENPPAIVTAPASEAEPKPESEPKPSPGFFDALGNWIKKSNEELDANFKKMKNSIDVFNAQADKNAKDAAVATKEATEALVKFPTTRFIEGRELCIAAANGSPDCRAAAELICKSKGFATGNSVDTQAAQKCPARIWLSGRKPNEGDCAVETFVTRAACQ
jgi:hypothetical protein